MLQAMNLPVYAQDDLAWDFNSLNGQSLVDIIAHKVGEHTNQILGSITADLKSLQNLWPVSDQRTVLMTIFWVLNM